MRLRDRFAKRRRRRTDDRAATASPATVEPTAACADQPGGRRIAVAERPGDRSDLLPLRIDAAILLDRGLRLKSQLAAERKSAGSRVLRQIEKFLPAVRGTAPRPVRSRKRDEDLRRCAAVLVKSGLFDPEYYLRRNPDVAAAGIDPVIHYLQRGASELRDPGPGFSTRWYVQRYPDVGASGRNPLYHFILSGYSEGRLPLPGSFAALSATDQDSVAAGMASASLAAPARSNARLVVYTALFGDYDNLFVPSREQAEACDFVLFTDQPNIPAPWRRGPITYAAPSHSRQNRFYKLLPHRLFPNHEWSLYLDGNVDMRMNPIEFLERNCDLDADFFVFRHPRRVSILEELGACIEMKKDDADLMVRQVAHYLESGFQHRFALTENNILLRRHGDPELVELSEAWWDEVRSRSGRDQLSLSYVVEKKDYRRIALFEEGRILARNFPGFSLRPHRHHSYPRDQLDDTVA